MDRRAGAELAPAQPEELVGREIGRQGLQQAPADERHPDVGAEARELAHHGLQHLLIPLAARDVRLGRIERVLADARVDQRALAVEVHLPLREPPAGPAGAADGRGVRAVEFRDDRARHDHVDPADLVDQVAELREVDDDHVVDGNSGVGGDRSDRQAGPADLVGRIDLGRPVPRDLDLQVARDREVVEAPVARVGVEERDRVRVPVAHARDLRRVVGAEEQDRRRMREERPLVGRESRPRGLRQPLVRRRDAAAEGEVAEHRPDDEEEQRKEKRDPDLTPPADLPGCATRLPRPWPRPAVVALPVSRRARPAGRRLRRRGRRDAALDAPAAVKAIRLLSAGRRHPAAYGSHPRWRRSGS